MKTQKIICTCLSGVALAGFAGSKTMAAITAVPDPSSYWVTVDTSSLRGQSAYIDLQFNGNLNAGNPPAGLTLSNFVTNGTLNQTDPYNGSVGDVSGTLPGTLNWGNGSSDSEYTEAITFGSTISFMLSFFGLALDQYNTDTGDVFVLDFINSAQNGYLLCADPDISDPTNNYGYLAGVVNISPDTANGVPAITPIAGPGKNEEPNSLSPAVVSFTAIPEPGGIPVFLVASALVGLGLRARRRAAASTR